MSSTVENLSSDPPASIDAQASSDAPDATVVDSAAEAKAAADAAKRAKIEPIARIAMIFIMPLLMVGMMISGYLGTMHSPTPHNMPIAVVSADSAAFVDALESADADAVNVTVVDSVKEARQMVMDRKVSGAVAIDGSTATLYTASAAGASQVSTVTSLVAPELIGLGLSLESTDLQALPDTDISGLGAMFLATALVMAGYLPFSVLVSNAPHLLLRKRRMIPLLAGWAALVAALVWFVTGPALGVVSTDHTAAVLGIAWLGVFAIGSVQMFFTRIFGSMAVLFGMLFLMVFGVPSSNMAMSVYTMPSFYAFMHNFLPTPAIGESLRSVLYFDGAGVWPHLLVLAIGAVVGLALTTLIDVIKRRRDPNPQPIVLNMPSLHGGKRPKSKFWRYASLLFFPLAMVSMMITLMLGAMGTPTPKDMPIAVAGANIAQAEQTVDALQENLNGMFELRAVASADDARQLVTDRDVVGALVLPSAENPVMTMVINQSAGSSASMIVTRAFSQVAAAQQVEAVTEDVAPLPASDSGGVGVMYIAMGWILAGFMVIVVGANAAPATRPLRKLLPLVGVYSLFMSAVVWLIAGPITGTIDGHFAELFGAGAFTIFCIAMFAAVFERLMGLLAVIPAVGILMFMGVPSSNGALSMYMVPGVFRDLHEWLPFPAAVETIRSIVYFGGDVVGAHLLTLGLWGAVCLAIVYVIDAVKPVRTTTEHVTVAPLHGPAAPVASAKHAANADATIVAGEAGPDAAADKELVGV
ncbi:ABC transporter permease [Leifsonia sp. A12D58]|uniref:ABC transporter permease n=1 Tax=Leifsonia sp. A12D58 TaxID=3397674 RepID=UPI0039E0C099